jgi:hypothetical protein
MSSQSLHSLHSQAESEKFDPSKFYVPIQEDNRVPRTAESRHTKENFNGEKDNELLLPGVSKFAKLNTMTRVKSAGGDKKNYLTGQKEPKQKSVSNYHLLRVSINSL